MSVLRLCLLPLLLFTHRTASAPSPAAASPALRPPHLEVSDADGRTTIMDKDISTFLKDLKCPHDLKLELIYSDEGRKYYPFNLKSGSIYNGNIDLLSLIHDNEWLRELCDKNIIKDLSSEDFCSELVIEEFLEASFILSMNSTLRELGFSDLMQSASELQRLKGDKQCTEECGGKYKSAMCIAFTAMSTFLMDQAIKFDNNLQQQASSQPETAEQTKTTVTPLNTTDTPSGSRKSDVGIKQPSDPANIPPEKSTPAPPSSPPFSKDDMGEFLKQYLSDKKHLKDIFGDLMPVSVSPSPSHQDNGNSGPLVGQTEDQNGPQPSGQISDNHGAPSDNNSQPNDQTNNLNGPLAGAPEAQTKDQRGPPIDDNGANSETERVPMDGVPSTDDHNGPQDDNNGRLGDINQQHTGSDDGYADGDGDGDGDVPLPTSLPEIEGVADDQDDEDGDGDGDIYRGDLPTTQPTQETKGPEINNGDVNIPLAEAVLIDEVEEDDMDDSESSGYGSMHFFGIILVLVIFAIVAYLCVYNKKRIKESMRDYVSDSQKRRRTRDYKPLLSGNK